LLFSCLSAITTTATKIHHNMTRKKFTLKEGDEMVCRYNSGEIISFISTEMDRSEDLVRRVIYGRHAWYNDHKNKSDFFNVHEFENWIA
jgi:hypothetical protein